MFQLIAAVLPGLLDKLLPDPAQAAEAKLRMLELAQRGDLAGLDAEMKLALGQLEVNKTEAGTDVFRGGWRPFAGWVCGMGLAYHFLLRPILPWVVGLFGLGVPAMPPIETDALMALLFGMLGLGGFRTFERVKGKV